MAGVDFTIRGLPELKAKLAHLGDAGPIDAVLEEAAFEIERRAKLRAPVDTGRLRASIATFQEAGTPRRHGVEVNVHYAAFQEFGTGREGAGGDQPGGVPPEYQHGAGVGIRSQPYLRPAVLEVREILKDPATWKDLV